MYAQKIRLDGFLSVSAKNCADTRHVTKYSVIRKVQVIPVSTVCAVFLLDVSVLDYTIFVVKD